MTTVAQVQVEAKIEWGSLAAGGLAIAADDSDTAAGTIAADDSDVTAGVMFESDWEASFGGDHDDVSSRVAELEFEAGRSELLDAMQARRLSLTLRDPDGTFNYANAAGPLYGEIADRMHPVKLRFARGGAWRDVFYGFSRRVTWQPRGRKGVAVVECVDLTYWLDRAKPVIESTGPTTTGAAIGLILDSIRWLDPDARSLDDGDTIPDFSADGSRTALELIGDLLEAERGVFYIDGQGRAVYEDRHARLLRRSETTIVDRMTNLEPEVDFDVAQNRVRVTRLDPTSGDAVYTAEEFDSDSVAKINYSDLPEIQTRYLKDDESADQLAAWILPLVVEPTSPVRELSIDSRDADLLDAILDLDLIDRLTLRAASGGTEGDFHVEHLQIRLNEAGMLAADYLLSPASQFSPLLISGGGDLVLSGGVITEETRAAALDGDGLPPDSEMGVWEATENLEATAGADVSFEAGTTGYVTGAGNTISSDGTHAKFGAASCKAVYGGDAVLLSIDLTLE